MAEQEPHISEQVTDTPDEPIDPPFYVDPDVRNPENDPSLEEPDWAHRQEPVDPYNQPDGQA